MAHALCESLRLGACTCCAAFCAACYCPFEMLVGCLQIMFAGHLRTVSDPPAYDVGWIRFLQLGLPAGPKVMEDSRPRCKAGPLDDPRQLASQVATGVTITVDHKLHSGRNLFPAVFQIWRQFGEDRHDPDFMARMPRGLGACYVQTLRCPIDIVPPQRILRGIGAGDTAGLSGALCAASALKVTL